MTEGRNTQSRAAAALTAFAYARHETAHGRESEPRYLPVPPPEQVVGSSIKTEFTTGNDVPVLIRLPETHCIDDGFGGPAGINERIGRCPIAAIGNSDGALHVLQWTMAGSGPR